MTIPEPETPEVYIPESAADAEPEAEDERDAGDERATVDDPRERPRPAPEP